MTLEAFAFAYAAASSQPAAVSAQPPARLTMAKAAERSEAEG